MKKLIALLLAALLCLSCVAFAEGETTYTAIPLGGSLSDYPLEGAQYGTYVKLDNLEEHWLSEGWDVDVYVDESAIVSHIAVYRRKNTKNETLDQIATNELYVFPEINASTAMLGNMINDPVMGEVRDVSGFYTPLHSYFQCISALDGEDVVQIEFHYDCDEIELIKDTLYAYIPKGYDDVVTTHDNYNVVFAHYSYPALHSIRFGLCMDNDYDATVESWRDIYPKFPINKDVYKEWIQNGWTATEIISYYTAMGGEYISSGVLSNVDWYTFQNTWYPHNEGDQNITTVLFIYIGDVTYKAWVTANNPNEPYFGTAFLCSLHTK